jgi:hypothetical protein
MSTRAQATFQVKSWDEQTCNEIDGHLKITQTSAAFAYSGDLDGESAMYYLMVYRDDGSATTSSLERINGRLCGKAGSFVLQHHGGYKDGVASGEFNVVEGSATGDLTGLQGQGTTIARQDGSTSVTLDYELGP